MKDPTQNILAGFQTALNSITYGSETVQVFLDVPDVYVHQYILLGTINLSDALTSDQIDTNCLMDIEVVVKGNFQSAERNMTVLNAISSSVMQAVIKTNISISGFTMTVKPFLRAATITKQSEDNNLVLTKVITIDFNVEETVS